MDTEAGEDKSANESSGKKGSVTKKGKKKREKSESRSTFRSHQLIPEAKRLTQLPAPSSTTMRTNSRLEQRRVSDLSFNSQNSFSRDTYNASQISNANFFMSKALDLEELMKIDFPSLHVMYVC